MSDEHVHSFGYVTIGRIVIAATIPRSYIVRYTELPSGAARFGVACEMSTEAHMGFMGPRRVGMYPPNTQVLIFVSSLYSWSFILGAVPVRQHTAERNQGDWVTGLGQHIGEDSVNKLLGSTKNSGMINFNMGNPASMAPGADVGMLNELGVGYGMSRFFSWLRASDVAGIWCMYLDNLVRIHSHNFEHWHAGGERRIQNDEGEISEIEWFNPYLWEASGVLSHTADPFKDQADGGICAPGKNNNIITTNDAANGRGQVGIPRLMKLRGFLGDIEREMVVIPESSKIVAPNLRSNDTNLTGVLDIQKHVDGLYTVRSAKGILHEKYIFLPVPQQKHEPEDKDGVGDGADNYKAAGVIGDTGEPHEKADWDTKSESGQDRLTGLPDELAYNLNFKNNMSLLRHERDWRLPEEKSEARPATANRGTIKPTSAMSAGVHSLPLPTAVSVTVDGRQNSTAKYYQSRSLIGQLDDGSIILEDGWGSYILLSGGNIYLSCPGDIFQLPGRNINMLAPHDIIARAGNSADITASKGDLRLKAERNLHALAGNSGSVGGLLLESRGTAVNDFGEVGEDAVSGGITLKTAGTISAYGREIYLRGYASESNPSGTVVIDAGVNGDILQLGRRQDTYVASSINQTVGYMPHQDPAQALPGNVSTMTLAHSTMALNVAGSMAVNSTGVVFSNLNGTGSGVCNIEVDGSALFGGSAAIMGNVLVGKSLGAQNNVVAGNGCNPSPLDDDSKDRLASQVTQATDSLNNTKTTVKEEFDLLVSNSLTNASTVEEVTSIIIGDGVDAIGFSARTPEQYGLDQDTFHLAEARWQQNYRQAGIGAVWQEPPILSPAGNAPTMPYPGYEIWAGAKSFRTRDNILFDQEAGANIPRTGSDSEVYNKAAAEDLNETSLQNGYLISLQR